MDHLALVTGDTAKTVDFYTRVMGWPLVGAQRGKEPDGRDYFISAFQGGGWLLEFEEVDGRSQPQPQAPGFPHIGLDVGTGEEYERWKTHLRSCGVQYLEATPNDCFFTDPNGLTFQLTVKSEGMPLQADTPRAAQGLVDEWISAHGER